MAINAASFASWGLLAPTGGPPSLRMIEPLEITFELPPLLEVSLEATEITVELSDG